MYMKANLKIIIDKEKENINRVMVMYIMEIGIVVLKKWGSMKYSDGIYVGEWKKIKEKEKAQ